MLDTLTAAAIKYQALLFYFAGFLGMLGHYVKKWGKGEYAGSLWCYLYADNPRATLAALITYAGAASAVAATGVLDGMKLSAIIGLGFTTGYVIDSSINSTTQK